MGNGQGIERRIHDEATNYEGDLFFCSLGAGGCFGRRESHEEERQHKPERGSNEWEREHGLRPPTSCSRKTDPIKSPCLVSFSVTNCFALKRQEDRDLDDEDHRGRGNESILSCGCARIGCLTPSWLNPQPADGNDDEEETDDERQRREQQVETSINVLKARQAEQVLVKQIKAKREKKQKKASNDVVEISAPHLETFRRTTDEFISAHLAMCPDPRARVAMYDNDNEDSGSAVRVVSLEASAPPPPSTDGLPAPSSTLQPLPPTPAVDARGRLPTTTALPTPNHLPPPPLPPATSSK